MRIAIYFENRLGRNDGAPLYYLHALRALGHTVDHLIPYGDLSNFGVYDLHLWVDWGEDALTGLLPYAPIPCPHPNVYVVSDTHVGWEYRLEKAKEFDLVCCNQREAAHRMMALGLPAVWHPHAFAPMAYNRGIFQSVATPESPDGYWQPCETVPTHDVCFIGHINSENRVEFLDQMFKAFPNFFYGRKLFHLAAEKFHSAKVVLNHAINDDLNMRVFEALGAGSCLVTQAVTDLPALFEEGVHVATWRTIPEAIEKTRYYLEHEDARHALQEAGYQAAHASHTYTHRATTLLSLARERDIVRSEDLVSIGGKR